MRKVSYWLLILLMVSLPLLSGCGGAPVPADAVPQPTAVAAEPTPLPLTTYQHPNGLFTILYPDGWAVEEEAEQVGFTNADQKLKILLQFTDVGQVLDETGIRTFIDSYFSAENFGSMPGFTRGETTSQQDGSILVQYSFESDSTPAYGSSFFEQHDTMLYILSFWSLDAELWDRTVSTFNAVANSFQAGKSNGEITGDWNTLTSAAGYFSIDYPQSWEGRELDRAIGAFMQKDEETFFIVIMTTTLPAADPSQSEQQLTEQELAAIRQDDPNAKIDGPDNIIIGGEEGVYADFTYVDPKTGLENKGTVISVVHNNRAYQLIGFTLSSDAEENIPLFTSILMSFNFTD